MKVLVLSITDKKVCLKNGIWAGGKGVTELDVYSGKHRLYQPVDGKCTYCPKWSLLLPKELEGPVIIKNDTLQDIIVSINHVEHKIPYRSTKCAPVSISLSESFKSYCVSNGLLTLSESQNEFCRIFQTSKQEEAYAILHGRMSYE